LSGTQAGKGRQTETSRQHIQAGTGKEAQAGRQRQADPGRQKQKDRAEASRDRHVGTGRQAGGHIQEVTGEQAKAGRNKQACICTQARAGSYRRQAQAGRHREAQAGSYRQA